MRRHPLISHVLSTRPARFVLGLLVALAVATPAVRAGDVLVALDDEERANASNDYEQEWGKIAMSADGSGYAVAWDSAVFHTLWLRYFDIEGVPRGPDILVNDVLDQNIQDEPMIAMDAIGRVLVCWSDRNGYDGFQMGCFGRAYGVDRQPFGPEFQITANVTPLSQMSSQWEPMPDALPGGGWVVAFNGDQDGNAYMRYLDVDGVPRTGDVEINTFKNNGQTEAEVSVSPNGVVLAIYDDFGGNVQAGTGQNLLARRFDLDGAPTEFEFVVNDAHLPFDQFEPRIDADAQGRFVVVWEDNGNDGDGSGIYGRRIPDSGAVAGPTVLINPFTTGDQILPEVAVDDAGAFVVVWEDRGVSPSRIVARRYAANGAPGQAFVVSGDKPGDYLRPSVAIDASGEHVVFCYSGPGEGGFSNNRDIYVRRYLLADDSVGPVADFSNTATVGLAPLEVSFTDTSSGGLIVDWEWDFGDGTTSELRDPSHVYAVPGTYTVTLETSGPGGASTQTKTDLVVVAPHATLALGDKVEGVISPDELHYMEFEAAAGTKLTLIAKRRGPDELQPVFRLVAPSGAVVAGAGVTPVNERLAKLPKDLAVLPETGLYKLQVSGVSGSAGTYKLSSKAKVPKSFKTAAPIAIDDRGEPEPLVIPAVAGTVIKKLIAKSQKPKGDYASIGGQPAALVPAVDVRSPSRELLTGGESILNAAGTRLLLKNLTLPVTGEYSIELSGADGSVGYGTITVKLGTAKGKTLHKVP